MSKITFRADDGLVDALEDLDASKSEVMRDALRTYLDAHGVVSDSRGTIDAILTERVDELVAERTDDVRERSARDVNVNITVEPGDGAGRSQVSEVDVASTEERDGEPALPGEDGERTCSQCGEVVAGDHVYCPNCGEKASRRVFCECGDEIRADWAFCPHCGRRTASADALDT